MDIGLSHTLLECYPSFPLLLQGIIAEQESEELLRPVAIANPSASFKSVVLLHDPDTRRFNDPTMATLVLDAAEYWVVRPRLEAIVADFRAQNRPHAVQLIFLGFGCDPSYPSHADEVERQLLMISENQHVQYFFLDSLEALARSIYALALALNPFRVRFREQAGRMAAEDVADATGKYQHKLLQVGGFTVPNVRAVCRVFPSPTRLMNALKDPFNNSWKDLTEFERAQLNTWGNYLEFALESGCQH
ncbi:hypothetical protein V5O48_016734 [Marasmius crinis-equi]|uniref:Uncharacterized protein n=1 Tax=Marasmius crinis-equi TaxID=585013 RepID=A0ABR3EQW8_9AGAR